MDDLSLPAPGSSRTAGGRDRSLGLGRARPWPVARHTRRDPLGARSPRRLPSRLARRSLSLGVDIGGTKVAAGVVNAEGAVIARAQRSTPATDAAAVEETIVGLVREFSAEYRILSVGIGAAGWMDLSGSTVLFSPHLAWRNEPLRATLEARLGRRILVVNDADAAGWGEYRFGAGRHVSRLACITLGTGIGGSLVRDGQLERGEFGLAGEFGHQIVVPDGHRCECGNRGCWEQYASGNALGREARGLARAASPVAHRLLAEAGGDPEAISGALVTALAIDGDPASRELLEDMGTWLGIGLANLAAALDPGRFVIGGGLGAAGDLLLEPARRAFARHLTGRGFRPVAPIEAAELGPDAGLVGAADLARVSSRARR
ncbi:ROK family glucokinase [Tersicoccus sp. MR15.9]|uniref:ROK family glucokinase n=1 Tax=Tersicoccus mangrovi TaxID=3121635 RepID=UPI002FE5E943